MKSGGRLASMVAFCLGSVVTGLPMVRASDCSVTSVGFVPMNDLGAGLYLGQFQGGLYPGV